MKRLNFIFVMLFVFFTSGLYSQPYYGTDLLIGTGFTSEQYLFHGRPNDHGDYLHLTYYDPGASDWAWNDGFTFHKGTGNVGIGTTSPISKLTVKGTGTFTKSDDLSKVLSFGYFNSSGNEYGGISAYNSTTTKNLILNGHPSNNLAVGYVGIGTMTPLQALDIGGMLRISQGVIQNGTTAVTGTVDLGLYSQIAYQNIRIVSNQAPIDFLTDANSNLIGSTVRMRILADGDVGIGTTTSSSGYKLQVKGKIRAEEIRVQTGWADFVFKPEYKLRTLLEVESYIKENGHLPEIPSEQEVVENGVELGNMSSKLLQKIEELTLYVIEQQREIERIKQINDEIKSKIGNK